MLSCPDPHYIAGPPAEAVWREPVRVGNFQVFAVAGARGGQRASARRTSEQQHMREMFGKIGQGSPPKLQLINKAITVFCFRANKILWFYRVYFTGVNDRPSSTVRMPFKSGALIFCFRPLGQSISMTSIFFAVPRPKWTRGSELDP